jgi:hypothetical protein
MKQHSLIIQEWLDIARWAASGGNAQPWLVKYSESKDQIQIFISIDPNYIPEHSPLDVQGTASVFSLGALATNFINIAAGSQYKLVNEECSSSQDLWDSKITLSFIKEASITTNYSTQDLLNRRTNRYPFQQKSIPKNLVLSIHNRIASYPSLKLFEFDSSNKASLIESIIPLENIRWKSQIYLEKLFFEISFDPNIQFYPNKIPVSQLGMNKVDQIFFKLVKKSKALQYLVRKVLYRLIVPKVLSGFSTNCDRLFVLQAKSSDAKDSFELGKAFQDLWIMINKEAIAFQPLGTPLVALGYWLKEPLVEFKPKEKETIEKVTEHFMNTYSIDLKKPTMVFRVGYPTESHGQAPRKSLSI